MIEQYDNPYVAHGRCQQLNRLEGSAISYKVVQSDGQYQIRRTRVDRAFVAWRRSFYLFISGWSRQPWN